MTVDVQKQPVILAKKVANEIVAPLASDIDQQRRFPKEAFAAFKENGLLGLLVPKEYGGMGGSLPDLVEVLEVIAKGCGSTAMCFLMHSCATFVMASKSPTDQIKTYLNDIAKGNKIGTLAFSERGTGAHFYQPEIKASFNDNHFILNGKKSFVTNGDQADFLVVVTNASQEEQGLDMVVVDRDKEGVRFEGTWEGIGLCGNNSIAALFENVKVPKSQLIGKEGDGMDLIFQAVAPSFLLGASGVNVGLARGAYDVALDHTKQRKYANGQSLAEITAIQYYIADMHRHVEAASTFARDAAEKAKAGDEAAVFHIMQSKIVACEAANQVTTIAMQVCGGQGYSRQLPVERYMRDAKAGSVMGRQQTC